MLKYVQCLYINYTSGNLKKKRKKEGREGERERRKEGANKEGGRRGKRKNVRRKGRRQLSGRGASFLLSGLMMRAAFLIQSPSGVLIFIYLHAAFVPCFFSNLHSQGHFGPLIEDHLQCRRMFHSTAFDTNMENVQKIYK